MQCFQYIILFYSSCLILCSKNICMILIIHVRVYIVFSKSNIRISRKTCFYCDILKTWDRNFINSTFALSLFIKKILKLYSVQCSFFIIYEKSFMKTKTCLFFYFNLLSEKGNLEAIFLLIIFICF